MPPAGTPFADLIAPGHAVVITQEKYTSSAIMGGLGAARICKLGAPLAVVDGRVRDVPELKLPVYARGTSTVGTGAGNEVVGVGGEVVVVSGEEGEGVRVCEGDWVFADEQGVVVFPRAELERVVGLVGEVVMNGRNLMMDVLRGRGLAEAVREHGR